MSDGYDTSIRYRSLSLSDRSRFEDIIRREFLGKAAFPEVSDGVAKKIGESAAELFNNSCMHSGSNEGVFLCGQYFPKKHRIALLLYDTGVGIPTNVKGFLKQGKEDAACIGWAMIDGNSTTSDRSGGLGLGVLKQFVGHNGGELVIVSGRGYYELRGKKLAAQRKLSSPLPGTAVSIVVRTDDTKSYVLAEEVGVDDIF